jgi:DNA invertase Pin-like site-specific DNA recombinase
MTRAIAYTRQSRGKEGEDEGSSLSLESQADAIRRYCAERGWELVETIRDHDLSGEDWQRPGMRELLAAAERGDVDAVVVYKLSRFSRDVLYQEITHRELTKRGVALHSVTEAGIDKTLMRLVYGGMNQQFNEDQREWLKGAIEARARRGLHHGRAPYGYRVPAGTDRGTRRLEIVESEAETVRWIFRMRAEGMGMISIANRLNAAGVPSKQRGTWGHASVRQLLKNPTYAGYVRHRGQIVGEADPANTPPIIDRALWHQVERMWQRGRATPETAEIVTWIQGLVDHACGSKMWLVASGTVDGSTRRKPYFTCGKHAQPAAHRCREPRAQIRAEPVERAALLCLAADLAGLPPSLDAALAAHAAALGQPDALDRRAELERRRDHLRASIARAEELVIGGLRDAAWFRAQDGRLQADLAAVDAELASLTEIPKPADVAPAFARVRELAAALPLLGDDARRRLLLALGRIRWDGSVRIVYAPDYRPLIPQPTVITPRYRPGVDEWIVELDAG